MELGFASLEFDMRPDVLRIAPVSRESTRVLWTPGFWDRRVRSARVSSDYSELVSGTIIVRARR